MEPRIVTMDVFKAVGMFYRGKNERDEIKEMWQRFIPRISEIKHRSSAMGEVFFGLCRDPEPEQLAESGEFEYIASLPVTTLEDIPEGMVGWEVPAQTYAVVEAACTDRLIRQAYDFIIKQWLPSSAYEAANGPDFELYPEEFATNNNDTIYIHFPIQRRA